MEMSQINVTWGQRLRQLRLERGLTATAVAREAGIARTTLHRIERGAHGASDEVKVRLAKAIGVSPNRLFDLRDAS